MIDRLKAIFRDLFLYDLFLKFRQHRDLYRWIRSGKAGLTPHLIKQATIREYANRFQLSIFIETGTFLGDMVSAMRDTFSEIISIELSTPLYKRAKRKYRRYPNIHLRCGDSTHILPEVLSIVNQPALFWLDGHYSADISARANLNTPVMEELEAIFNHKVIEHVILIDDARCFNGENDYPNFDELKKWVHQKRPEFTFDVVEDIIRIYI